MNRVTRNTIIVLFVLALSYVLLGYKSSSVAEESITKGRVEVGREIYTKRGCSICHSYLVYPDRRDDETDQTDQIRKGGMVGPDLTQVGLRRTEEWLFNWLDDPPIILPGTDMPAFEWESDQEILDVIAYLVSLQRPVDAESILERFSSEEAGRRLVEAYDCQACHRIMDGGRTRYPDLTHVGSKIYPEWETRWLKNPQSIKPGTYMPTFPLTERERKAIASYLHTLK